MTTVICPHCNNRFDTSARSGRTRCGNCRRAVTVRKELGAGHAGSTQEHTLGVVLLSCGHPAVVVVHPGRPIAATLKRYEWECPDTGDSATPTQVLTVISEADYENMSQEAFDLLISTGTAS